MCTAVAVATIVTGWERLRTEYSGQKEAYGQQWMARLMEIENHIRHLFKLLTTSIKFSCFYLPLTFCLYQILCSVSFSCAFIWTSNNNNITSQVTEEQFNFEVNEISWNNESDLFFLTNGLGCIHIMAWVHFIIVLTKF